MHRFSDSEIGSVLYPWGHVQTVGERPFDREACVQLYKSALPRRAGRSWGWREDKFTADFVGVRGILSPEEARFWFAVGTDPARLEDTQAQCTSCDARFELPDDDAVRAAFAAWIERYVERCGDLKVVSQAWLARILCDVLEPGGALDAVLHDVPERAIPGFLEHLLPPSPDELPAYRRAGANYLAALDYRSSQSKQVVRERRKTIAQRLAPMLRDDEAVGKLLDLYEREPPASRSNAVMHLINAVDDDAEFLERFKARVKEWGRRELVLLVGRLGEEGLEVVRDAVVRRNRDASEGLATALASVDHPDAADILLHLAQSPASGVVARDVLLDASPAHVAGLLAVAAGRSRRAELAESVLQEIRRRDPDALQAAAQARTDIDADMLEAAAPEPVAIDLPELPEAQWPEWLHDFARKGRPKGLPRFLTNDFVPVFMTADAEHILPKRAVYGLLQAARDFQAPPDPETGEERDSRNTLVAFRELLDPESATYGFRVIFDRWNQEGASPRHDWCLRVMSLFGDDAFALELARWTDEWPKHDLTEVAETAIEVLAAMNSDAALMSLNGIAQRGTFAGIRRWARSRLDRLAVSRGIGGDELRDMVIDQCGLDDDGTMAFDYGTRTFQLVFDADLKPRFRDDEGKVQRSLPRARKTDDAARVNAARARFKLVKKRLSEVLKTQRRRLEDYMIDGRRLKVAHWKATHVDHPLMTHLVQRFVWGVFRDGSLEETLRVDEARELVDIDDEPIDLKELAGCRIGLVHPLELSASERHQWSSLLGDYEIVPPFPQLDRDVYPNTGAEQMIGELRQTEVAPGALRGQLKRLGWTMGYAADDGRCHFFSRRMGRADLWAWLVLSPGLNAADWRKDRPQKLAEVGFRSSRRSPESTGDFLPPRHVDRVAWSEVMRMMSGIFGD